MKRILRITLLLLSIAGIVYADEKEDFKNLIEKNTGYYYCEKNNKLAYLSMSHDNMLTLTGFSVNFETGVMKMNVQSQSNVFYNEGTFYETRARFEIRGNKILSFDDFPDGTYIPVPYTSEKELVDYMKLKTVAKFERIIGVYYDEDKDSTKTFSVSKRGGDFVFAVFEQDGSKQEEVLTLTGTSSARGKTAHVEFFKNRLFFTGVADVNTEKYLYDAVFTVEEDEKEKKNDAKAEFYHNIYRFGENKSKLIIGGDRVIVTQGSEWDKTLKYDLYSFKYKTFVDEYGYKQVHVGDEKFVVIDGKRQNIAFRYRGPSLKNDAEAVKKVFKAYPDTWTPIIYFGGYKNINGGYFKNVKASSVLKDAFYEYAPEGTMKVFNPSEDPGFWVKNNIPWAEGKKDDGIGEFIEFDIVPTDWRAVVGIDLRILNGYVDPLKPHLFYENNRLKKALLETDGGFTAEISFNDTVEFTSVTLPKETVHVKLTIKEVYLGTKYRDTCISAFDMYYDLWDK
ncbi:hypothetical protein H0R92_05785 [Treponema sp. OMZ 840]|uniref:NADase-type glycan-binding domain-containing protein n=1 Tax=Treponema sp. OMZ 840 TaxID=244313 RepID=UPI003D8BD4C8